MPEAIHAKLIYAAAKEALAPLGCVQRGRSRTWIDDQAWWIIVIEFQPGRSKGSYLNVGAMWLWDEKSHFSFDDGYRTGNFAEFTNEEQFAREALQMASLARERALAIREKFSSIEAAAHHLQQVADSSPNPWHWFHAGVAAGLVGEIDAALGYFRRLEDWKTESDWHLALQSRATELALLVKDGLKFREEIAATITRARKLLKLQENKIFHW